MNCKVMGIVNVTPDSFSDGGQFFKPQEAIRRVKNLFAEGADVIDLGAESTRPGATPLSWEEEWARLEAVLAGLKEGRETRDERREQKTRDERREGQETGDEKTHKISVDTYHPETAERALKAGARMINCVYAEPVAEMAKLCARYGAELVVPATALDSLNGCSSFVSPSRLSSRVSCPPTNQTIAKSQNQSTLPALWLDPMIGFGTTREEDIERLRSIPELAKVGRVLVGVSRKRIVRRLSGEHGVGKLLGGSVALALWCAAHGASMVRVHDVRETVEALAAWSALAE